MEKPLVSILMTAYNREKYIAEAIESVIASTYQNWELIIVDDVSKDKTVEIAKSYEAKDSRIKVYINEKNLGQFPNRNLSAQYAKGKYLKFIDSDDYIYPYGLEQLVFYMEQFNEADYGLCSLNQDDNRIYPFMLSPYEAYKRHYFQAPLFHKAPLSSIIKREAYLEIGGCTHHQISGDFYLWNALSQRFNVVLMPEGIVWYREHEEGEMAKTRQNCFIAFEYLQIEEQIIQDIKCPLNESEKALILKKIKRKQARFILRHSLSHSFKIGHKLLKMTDMNLVSLIINAFSKS